MSGETTITVVGNLTGDPELRFTPAGAAVTNFTVASTPRTYDKQANEWRDGETLFLRCSIWREPAENVAESLQKGMRVIVTGYLKSRSYETREGEKRTVFELDAQEVGPSLHYATAKVTRTPRRQGGDAYGQSQPAQQRGRSTPPPANPDPWAGAAQPSGGDPWGPPAGQGEEPPF